MDTEAVSVPAVSEAVTPEFYEQAKKAHMQLVYLRVKQTLIVYHQAEILKRIKDCGLWKPFVNEGDVWNHYIASPEVGLSPHKASELLRIAKAMEALDLTAKDLEGVASTRFVRLVFPCLDLEEEKTESGTVWKATNKEDALELLTHSPHLAFTDFEQLCLEYRETKAREAGELTVPKKIDEGPAFRDASLNTTCGYVVSSFASERYHTIKLRIHNEALAGDGPYTIVLPSCEKAHES